MGLLSKVPRPRKVQRIPAETLGLFDLSGGAASNLVSADSAVLGRFFQHVRVETRYPPKCTVLFIYGSFTVDGTVLGYPLDLGQIIAEATAPIVVIATPHSGETYTTLRKRSSHTPSNLVLTLDRRDDAFASFFEKLFADMKSGTSMTVAWVKLSPQGPPEPFHEVGQSLPDMIFECSFGQLALV